MGQYITDRVRVTDHCQVLLNGSLFLVLFDFMISPLHLQVDDGPEPVASPFPDPSEPHPTMELFIFLLVYNKAPPKRT